MVISGVASFSPVALVPVQPENFGPVAAFFDQGLALGGDRAVGVFRDFGAGEHRNPFVEQVREAAHQPGFRLAALAEKDDILVAEQRIDELRNDAVVVAPDAGKEGFAGPEPGDQVPAQLRLDRQRLVAGGIQFAQRGGLIGHDSRPRAVSRSPLAIGHLKRVRLPRQARRDRLSHRPRTRVEQRGSDADQVRPVD